MTPHNPTQMFLPQYTSTSHLTEPEETFLPFPRLVIPPTNQSPIRPSIHSSVIQSARHIARQPKCYRPRYRINQTTRHQTRQIERQPLTGPIQTLPIFQPFAKPPVCHLLCHSLTQSTILVSSYSGIHKCTLSYMHSLSRSSSHTLTLPSFQLPSIHPSN